MDDGPLGPLELELLPARHGDALLITWGPLTERHRMLIDGGPASAYPKVSARLREIASQGPLDLLVLTHIDADHIEGTLLLTNDVALNIGIGEYWFSGPAQVSPDAGRRPGRDVRLLVAVSGHYDEPGRSRLVNDAEHDASDPSQFPSGCPSATVWRRSWPWRRSARPAMHERLLLGWRSAPTSPDHRRAALRQLDGLLVELPGEVLVKPWAAGLVGASRSRWRVLDELAALASVTAALGGGQGIQDIIDALEDVERW